MKMTKLTYIDFDWTNKTLNPSFSQWVQKVKDNKTKTTCTFCKKTFSLSNMGSTALKSHIKSEKHKKNASSVNDRQIKITNVFVNTSKFESTSVFRAFKQDDASSEQIFCLQKQTSTSVLRKLVLKNFVMHYIAAVMELLSKSWKIPVKELLKNDSNQIFKNFN